MTANPILDSYTEIGALSLKVRSAAQRALPALAVLCVLLTAFLWYRAAPGTLAFALMALGSLVAVAVWDTGAIGLPLLPMIAMQNLIIYGLPILASHENILTYRPDYLLRSGVEVMVLNLAMALAWKIAMGVMVPKPAVSFVLHELNRAGTKGWRRMGFILLGLATAFQVLYGLNLLGGLYALLPSGSDSLINTLLAVVSVCGFFFVSMVIGNRDSTPLERACFWLFLTANILMSASSFLLSAAAAYVISVAMGLFWSTGRAPWKFLVIAVSALAFLNVGKTTMRSRYWSDEGAESSNVPFSQIPSVYSEWFDASSNALLENSENSSGRTTHGLAPVAKNQTLLDRIDNLQNLLFVVDAIDEGHIKPLHGKTYSLIPPLLVPRIFWPNKPRSHEGQVLLNVHFGRQDLDSTFTTYIAWGLLPEAYGNFGPLTGSVLLGAAMGVFFAWVENATARKLLVSCEGFISLSLFMNVANSFEMVASVLITSTFQSIIIVIVACIPFVNRMPNPTPPEASP
jgi:hypothetical protein